MCVFLWKSDLSDKIKRNFFQAAVVSLLLYGCTTWTLTRRRAKKLDGNYTRILRAILNKSWKQHSTKKKLHSHLPPISKTIQIRLTRHVEHCWRRKDELISDVHLWTLSQGHAKTWTYLCTDTGCRLEDLVRIARERERERESQENPC